ncbi:MAG: dTDP-4-dehydrorhamnose reductase [Luminiphilus sp.]|nr:dTDP-4-dehydrorhamnose reductase [Luminiphilus sp.]
MSKALMCGAGGQLGQELVLTCPEQWQAIPMTRSMLDIADPGQVARALDDTEPAWVINAAAFTAVDAAESEPDSAHRVNAIGPETLALQCRERNIRFLHVSTDFVFDGTQGRPYAVDAEPNPLGAYGRSKLEGENAVMAVGASPVVLRTGWVYSRHGGNFVKTMLRLMAEREQLSVVEDQIGTPTWARGLALACWGLADHGDASGIYHWSDAGACSWYDFAVAIREIALELGLLRQAATLLPIPASQYPTPAQRPAYSVLDKTLTRNLLGQPGDHWASQLRAMLVDLQQYEKHEL